MKWSACWIVKDEAEELRRSIESVRQGVDELLVVDTGGTVQVPAVAAELGARVAPFVWTNDFAEARNFALDQVPDADVVVFLDADEWFEPAFEPKRRAWIEQQIQDEPHLDGFDLVRNDIDTKTGLVGATALSLRIFAMHGGVLRYGGAIHEGMERLDKRMFVSRRTNLVINHTGYSRERMEAKVARNLQLLEQEYTDETLSAQRRAAVLAYLIREYDAGDRREELCKMVRQMLDMPDFFRLLVDLPEVPLSVALRAVNAAAANRGRFSRREIFQKVVLRAEKAHPDEAAYKLPRLFYYHLLQRSEQEFVREVPEYFPPERFLEIIKSDRSFLFSEAPKVYGWMAMAMWRRGDVAAAFDYASKAFLQEASYMNGDTLMILLNCMRGQPEADQILLLENLFGTANQTMLSWLVGMLPMQGGKMLYLFYFKRLVDKGWATKANYFYAQLVQGRTAELEQSLQSAQGDTDPELVGDLAMLLALCTGKANSQVAMSAACREIVNAYFTGSRLEKTTGEHLKKLHHYYALLMTVNQSVAERYLNVFRSNPKAVLIHKAEYCMLMGTCEKILEEPLEGLAGDVACATAAAACLCRCGLGERALTLLEGVKAGGIFSASWMNTLLLVVVWEGGNGPARALFDESLARADELYDIQDVTKTGVVFDDVNKKQMRALAKLTLAGLDASIAKDPYPLQQAVHWKVIEQAADVYSRHHMAGMMERCYSRMATAPFAGRTTWEGLARAYEALGNAPLAKQLRERAQASEPEEVV